MNGQYAVVVMLLVGVLASGLPAAPTDGNEPPLADAGLDQSVSRGSTVLLDGGGSRDPDGEIASYSWTITAPDGSSVDPGCPSCERTQFVAAQRGVYEVTLTVTDDDGARSSDTLYVTVGPGSGLSVTLAGPDETTVGKTVQYDATVDGGTAALDELVWRVNGTVVHREDIASDDTTERLQHSFTDPGTANVSVTAVDDAGNVATDGLSVSVTSSNVTDSNDPPTAFIQGPNRVTPDTSVTFVLDATDPDNDTLSVSWTNVDTGSMASATKSFDGYDPGDTVTITAEVSDGNHTVTATKTVQVVGSGGGGSNEPPQASISGPSTVTAGEWGNFDVKANDPDGTVVDISWSNVYDSGIDDPVSVTREFSSPGKVTISVTVTDDDGASTTAKHTVNVTRPSTSTATSTETATATATPKPKAKPKTLGISGHTNQGPDTKKSGEDLFGEPVTENQNTVSFTIETAAGGAEPGTPVQVSVNFGDTSVTNTLVVNENGKLPDLKVANTFPDINETTTFDISATASYGDWTSPPTTESITFTPANNGAEGKKKYGVTLSGPDSTEPGRKTYLKASSPTKYLTPPKVVVYFGDGPSKALIYPDYDEEYVESVGHTYDDPGRYVASAVAAGHSSNAQAKNDQVDVKVSYPTYTVWKYNESTTVYNNKFQIAERRPGPDWQYVEIHHTDKEYVTSIDQPREFSAPSADPPYHWEPGREYYNDYTDSWWQEWDKYKSSSYIEWKKVVELEKEGPTAYSSSVPAEEAVYKDTVEKVTYSCEDSGNPLWGDHCTNHNGGGEI